MKASNTKRQTTGPTKDEFDALMRMRKVAEDPSKKYKFPGDEGGLVQIPLVSDNRRENFVFDINRRRIVLNVTYNARTKAGIRLARLDFDAGHRNPDGTRVGCPHLHYYREGYVEDAWATDKIPFDVAGKSNQEVLDSFLEYCNIEPLNIEYDLFSK